MNDFDTVISFSSLYEAFKIAKKGKLWKKEVILFESKLSENLYKLHYTLLYGNYKVSGYHSFYIYEPKKREIQAITFQDRIVQHSFCDNYLMPILERKLIYDNCACRKKKGLSFAIKRIRYFMSDYFKKNGLNGYFIKLDIHHYFPSIDHKILKEKMNKIILDENLYKLFCLIIDSFNDKEGKGLPMGNQTSQACSIYYLDSLDRYLKEKRRIKYYLRYMDDLFIIVNTKEEAKEIIEEIVKILKDTKLELNPKSSYFPLKNGIEFLGFYFSFTITGKIIQKVKQESKRRMIRNVKKSLYLCREEIDIEESKIQLKGSYHGHLKGSDSFKLETKINNIINRY